VVSSESQISLIGSRVLYGITFGEKITITDVLKRKIQTIFIVNFNSIVSCYEVLTDVDG
jgi:hypothetical protein